MKTIKGFAAALLLAGTLAGEAQAQLAITEVMTESATNGLPGFRGPDFWELTNFGADDLDLDGFGFSDNNSANVFTYPFTNLVIRAGESILFCRTNVFIDTLAEFKAWWGEQNLPADLQVRFYVSPGFDGDTGDEVWLRDRSSNVVDMVAYGGSRRGRTLSYEPVTGTFGVHSVAGVDRVFRAAASTNDVGSPGFTAGPVPLFILQQPASQTVDGCGSVSFSVLAGGLPRPRYQWTSNGIPILGATGPTFLIAELDPSSGGEFRVSLDNGQTQSISTPAILTVNTNPLAPLIIKRPSDSTVFAGQTATFSIETRGFPCLQYQWESNGVPIAGATGRTLSVPIGAGATPSSNHYTVTAWNDRGSTNASARLAVVRRPCLQITELMSTPTNSALLNHLNWFELTNCDTNEVNLQGYRFRDAASLAAASTITNALVLRPGESAVFVEFMSPAAFKQWWGAGNLPPALQIITWGGWGLSSQGNDVIHFWNSGATDPLDTVATASHLAAIPGWSMELESFCDESFGCAALYLRDSVAAENGAWRAVEGGDIGSPGYTANPPPRLLGLSRSGARVTLSCRVVEGRTIRLSGKSDLADPLWISITTRVATNSIITMEDTPPANAPRRFYRLEELP